MIARFRIFSLAGSVGFLLMAAAIVQGGIVTVPNFSFEDPDLSGTIYAGQGYNDFVPGWLNAYGVFGEALNIYPSHGDIVGGEGNQAAWLGGPTGSYSTGTASQMWTNTSEIYEAGNSYEMKVGVSRISYAPGVSGASLDLWFYYLNPDGTFGSMIGTPTTATYDTTFASTMTDFTVNVPTLASDDPAFGGTVCVAFYAMNNPGDMMCWLVDNVRVTSTPVPEPGTIALLATGLLGLLAYAWRKKK
jgi:hypothetical protein